MALPDFNFLADSVQQALVAKWTLFIAPLLSDIKCRVIKLTWEVRAKLPGFVDYQFLSKSATIAHKSRSAKHSLHMSIHSNVDFVPLREMNAKRGSEKPDHHVPDLLTDSIELF